jgi:hypothetical protein
MSVPREVGVSTFAGRKQGSEASARKAGPWFLEGTVQPLIHPPRISRLAPPVCLSSLLFRARESSPAVGQDMLPLPDLLTQYQQLI